ncbi:MAG: hypothetical protein ABJV04_14495 [Aliiglaciecola sp.]|uniref:hypothetical protein n=1 Tax=Aliiglaciecola sp. TaxID=1872441 RepID=UPI00329707C4
MNPSKRLASYLSLLYIVLSLCLLGGCQSTDVSEAEPECRSSEEQESCESGDESERGYDPCLVNQSLPVCKP